MRHKQSDPGFAYTALLFQDVTVGIDRALPVRVVTINGGDARAFRGVQIAG